MLWKGVRVRDIFLQIIWNKIKSISWLSIIPISYLPIYNQEKKENWNELGLYKMDYILLRWLKHFVKKHFLFLYLNTIKQYNKSYRRIKKFLFSEHNFPKNWPPVEFSLFFQFFYSNICATKSPRYQKQYTKKKYVHKS